ncbi:MAG: hypothetical protein ACFFG0_07900 [Candidatus Thorarchaeota archaeon]
MLCIIPTTNKYLKEKLPTNIMELICYKCSHKWDYKGKSKYLTCPNCLYKIRLDKAMIKIPTTIPTIPTTIPTKKQYGDYEDPRCKVTDNLEKEWIFPKPVLKDGEQE